MKFDPNTKFLDVEGIPVTINAGEEATPYMVCAAWDTRPPRPFPIESAHRNGTPLTREEFMARCAR